MRARQHRRRIYLACLAAGAVVLVLLPGGMRQRAGKESIGEFLREHREFDRRTLPIAYIREKLGAEGEASREVLAGPAQEEYENRAYPSAYVEHERAVNAARAFQVMAERSTVPHAQWWQEVGPRTAYVPGPVTYTGVPTLTAGRTTAIAVADTCGEKVCRVWVGAAGGGVWATENGLAPQPAWHPASDGLLSGAIGAILIDPTDPAGRTLYAGTGEPNGSSDSEAGMGLFKSTDYGRTWSLVAGSVPATRDRSIAGIAVDPADRNHLYIGTAVARHGASSVNGGRMTPPDAPPLGLYESTDGGATFRLVFSKPADSVDPRSPNGGDFFRGGVSKVAIDSRSHQVYFAMFGYGLFRKTVGAQFEQVFASAAGGSAESSIGARTEFALAPDGGRLRIYVGDTDGGPADFYRVDDANVAAAALTDGLANPGWTKLSAPATGTPGYASYNYCNEQCSYDMPIASPPGYPDHVWIGGQMQYDEIFTRTPPSNGRAVQRSTDGGVHFTDMTNDARGLGMHPDQHVIAFAPGHPNIAFIGSDGGLVRTGGEFTDASGECAGRGITGDDLTNCEFWLKAVPTRIFSLNNGLGTLQFQSVAVNPGNPRQDIMGGTQDNGTWAYTGPARRWVESVGGDGGQSGIDAVNPNIRVHSYYGPFHDVNFRGSDPLGWNWISDPLYYSGEASSFYVPIITDPVVGGSMFVGLQHVWRTKDSGGPRAYLEEHCNEFTGDFTAQCGDWEPLGGPTLTGSAYGADKGGSYVVAVARAAGDPGTLWAATRRGRLFIAGNADAGSAAGVTFTRIDAAAQPTRFISGIAVDPRDPHHAFVSFSGYDAYTPATPGHVFEVRYNRAAGTAAWRDLSYDLGDQPITGIAYDDVSGTLYASSDFGVAALPAGGASWTPAAPGLPVVAVYGLTLSSPGRLLYAATHGRGIWRLNLGK